MDKQILTVAAVDPRELGPFLKARLGLDGATAERRVAEGAVWISGRRAKARRDKLAPGERVTVYLAAAKGATPARAPAIIYSDERLLVIDKPAGLDSQPSRRGGPSLLSVLPPPLFLVHRLDAEASGLLVLGRDAAAATTLQRGLGDEPQSQRRPSLSSPIGREYLALVSGVPQAETGTIDLRIGRAESSAGQSSRYQFHPAGSTQGQAARTHYRRLGPPPAAALEGLLPSGPLSLIWLKLESGRTHQIRLHLAALGHPIVGDRLYGGAAAGRLYLHAARLRLHHPDSHEELCFESLPPAGFPSLPLPESPPQPAPLA
jgi:RluA family pseudouridine synthase